MKFIVDRKTWLRGEAFPSNLLNEDGKKCCLGFLAQACQVPDDELLHTPLLCNLSEKTIREKLPPSLFKKANRDFKGPYLYYYTLEHNAAIINDDPILSPQEREQQLTELFAACGITVHFID